MNLPNKAARKQFVIQHLHDAGFSMAQATDLARLVPDMFLIHATQVTGRDLHLKIVNSHRVFLQYGEEATIYLGDCLDSGVIRAHTFWNDLDIAGMTSEESAAFNLDNACNDFPKSKWATEFSALENPSHVLTVDIVAALREFTGGE